MDAYRLTAAMVAVAPESSGPKILTIGAGALVEVIGPVQKSGLVEVRVEEEILNVFARDLEQRGQRVQRERA